MEQLVREHEAALLVVEPAAVDVDLAQLARHGGDSHLQASQNVGPLDDLQARGERPQQREVSHQPVASSLRGGVGVVPADGAERLAHGPL